MGQPSTRSLQKTFDINSKCVFSSLFHIRRLVILLLFLLHSLVQEVFFEAVSSEFGMNETYQTIVTVTTSVLFTFLPLILLATFNCFLVAAVHNSTKIRRGMTNSRKVSGKWSFVEGTFDRRG